MKHWLCAALVLTSFVLTVGLFAQDKARSPDGATKVPPAGPEERRQFLEVVGALAGAHLYQTYLNIGLIADGKAEGTYEEKDARQILRSVLALLDTLDKQLQKVGQFDLGKEDRASLEQVRKLSALLRQQGDELEAFWKTGDKERGAKYEKTRKEAWEGISKLLGLQ